MGINPEKNWEAHYAILPGKEKVIHELKALAKSSSSVYLATDLDREGGSHCLASARNPEERSKEFFPRGL